MEQEFLFFYIKAGKWNTHMLEFQNKIQLKICSSYWNILQFYIDSLKLHCGRGKEKHFSQCAKWQSSPFSPVMLWNVPYMGPMSLLDLLTVSQLRVWLHLLSIKLPYHLYRPGKVVMVHNVKLTKVRSCCSYSQRSLL